MKALRDVEADLYRFRTRVLAATVLVGLALFLTLWLVNQDQKIKEAVERAFRSPLMTVTDASSGVMPSRTKQAGRADRHAANHPFLPSIDVLVRSGGGLPAARIHRPAAVLLPDRFADDPRTGLFDGVTLMSPGGGRVLMQVYPLRPDGTPDITQPRMAGNQQGILLAGTPAEIRSHREVVSAYLGA